MEAAILLLLPLELPFCFRVASVMRVKLLGLSAHFPQTLEHICGTLPFCFGFASVALAFLQFLYGIVVETFQICRKLVGTVPHWCRQQRKTCKTALEPKTGFP